jgi:hypothetical protein
MLLLHKTFYEKITGSIGLLIEPNIFFKSISVDLNIIAAWIILIRQMH